MESEGGNQLLAVATCVPQRMVMSRLGPSSSRHVTHAKRSTVKTLVVCRGCYGKRVRLQGTVAMRALVSGRQHGVVEGTCWCVPVVAVKEAGFMCTMTWVC